MDQKRLVRELRQFADEGAVSGQASPGYEEFATCLADHVEKANIHHGEHYLRRHIVQIVLDAWEWMRFSAPAQLRRVAYLQTVSYSEMPDLVNVGMSEAGHRHEAVQSIAFMLADIYGRESEMLADAVEEEFLNYCESQDRSVLHALHAFLRCVWRQGLYQAIRAKRKTTVCLGEVDVTVTITPETLQLTFTRNGREFWFMGSPDDELGLEFTLVGVDIGVTVDMARATIIAVVEADIKRRTGANAQPYFIVE